MQIADLQEDFESFVVVGFGFGELPLLLRHDSEIVVSARGTMLVVKLEKDLEGFVVVGLCVGELLLLLGYHGELVINGTCGLAVASGVPESEFCFVMSPCAVQAMLTERCMPGESVQYRQFDELLSAGRCWVRVDEILKKVAAGFVLLGLSQMCAENGDE